MLSIKRAEDDLKKEIEKQNRLLKEKQDKILKEEQDILKAQKAESNKNIKRRNNARSHFAKRGPQQNFDLEANQKAWKELRKEVVKIVELFPIDLISVNRRNADINKREHYIDLIMGKEPSVDYFFPSIVLDNLKNVKAGVQTNYDQRNPWDSHDIYGVNLYPDGHQGYEYVSGRTPPHIMARHRWSNSSNGGNRNKLLKNNKKTHKC